MRLQSCFLSPWLISRLCLVVIEVLVCLDVDWLGELFRGTLNLIHFIDILNAWVAALTILDSVKLLLGIPYFRGHELRAWLLRSVVR